MRASGAVRSRGQPWLGSASRVRLGWRDAEASWAAESCCSAWGGSAVLEQGCGSLVPSTGVKGEKGELIFGWLQGHSVVLALWEAGLLLCTRFLI